MSAYGVSCGYPQEVGVEELDVSDNTEPYLRLSIQSVGIWFTGRRNEKTKKNELQGVGILEMIQGACTVLLSRHFLVI
jgi:hypothetical protein